MKLNHMTISWYCQESKAVFLQLIVLCLLILSACQPSKSRQDTIVLNDYRVFYDGQDKGYSTIGGHFIQNEDEITGVFIGETFGSVDSDYSTGKSPFLISSIDTGKTWSVPMLFGRELIINPEEREKEALGLSVFGPTKDGTLICQGNQFIEGEKGSGSVKDPEWRDHTLIIGRKEKNATGFTYNYYPGGTFLGEQFMDGCLQLPSGRIVFTIWGAKNKGENWRCGVMLSDDDGISWKYRDVAYEPDLNIRDKPEVIAGFNEQSLFLTEGGKLISIIRGRDKLGRVEASPRDTWFLRSESRDNGETWSQYEQTNVPGTGAAAIGLTLPDGSLLHACRIPYSRDLYELPEPECYGLHFVRSYDEGKTWKTERFIQSDPEGRPFRNYYNAMNGQFLKINAHEWLYIFGHFDMENNIYRILSCRITLV
jgi:hypothetical protein